MNPVDLPDVVGLGDVGLDRTEPVSTAADQMIKLEQVLFYLQRRHVLVLRCRSLGEVADEAVLSVTHLLQGHPYVSREQLIHLHCFAGTWPVAQRWIQ